MPTYRFLDTETDTETATAPTTFEQTQQMLSGTQLREARGRGPEDRGSYSDRFGTAEDQGYGYSVRLQNLGYNCARQN